VVTDISIAREALAVIALSYVGAGDVHERVWLDTLDPPQANPVDAKHKPLSWCRAFVLHCLRERYRAAHGAEPPADWVWLPGRGFEGPHDLQFKPLPHVGAEAYRHHGQHGAIVVRVPGDGTVITVDGNSFDGKRYGVVAERRKHIGDWTGFFSLDPMLA
jgi:hypothetical protein